MQWGLTWCQLGGCVRGSVPDVCTRMPSRQELLPGRKLSTVSFNKLNYTPERKESSGCGPWG